MLSAYAQTKCGGYYMKNGLLIGVALGVITATALYQRTMQKKDGAFKRGANAIVKKIGDILD